MFQDSNGDIKVGKIISLVVVALIIIIIVFGSVGTVGAGDRGSTKNKAMGW